MKLQNIFFVISLLLIIFICSYIIKNAIENFEVVESVDFYIVTMKGEDRMKNIEAQKEKLKANDFDTKNFYLFDAVVGKTLDLDQLTADGILDPNPGLNNDPDPVKRNEIRQREVGCYLSHMKAIETIQGKDSDGYSIIFEDDFDLSDDFLKILDETLVKIKSIDFDLLFLGIIGYNGENVLDNIYNIHNGDSWGTHGYLVNNRSAGKILEKMKYIDTVLDKEYFDKGKAKELIVYRLDPLIVNTAGFSSDIR